MPWGSSVMNYAVNAWKGMGVANRRTLVGGLIGGAYGAMSDNTSVLGGAFMGATGARYLGAGFNLASTSGAGMGFRGSVRAYGSAFGRGVVGRARQDFRIGSRLVSNMGANAFRGLAGGPFG